MAGKQKKAKPRTRSTAKAPTEARPVGRPTLYDPSYCRIAQECAKLGATDSDLARVLGVSDATIDNWKAQHPEFLGSLNAGKDEVDAIVVRRLFERATGYSHPAEKIFQSEGTIVRADYTEHYPPDTTAAIFWLKNRRKEDWRDKHDVEHSASASLEQILAASYRKPGES